MKMKMTLAAGALALAFAGQASAAIVAGNTFANNLVLTVWDQTSLTSFTANLGTNMQSFLTGAGLHLRWYSKGSSSHYWSSYCCC